jgi:Domain of unknown function (DUF5615)
MRFKVDENLHPGAAAFLAEQGHDALSVWDQNLRGAKDPAWLMSAAPSSVCSRPSTSASRISGSTTLASGRASSSCDLARRLDLT